MAGYRGWKTAWPQCSQKGICFKEIWKPYKRNWRSLRINEKVIMHRFEFWSLINFFGSDVNLKVITLSETLIVKLFLSLNIFDFFERNSSRHQDENRWNEAPQFQ